MTAAERAVADILAAVRQPAPPVILAAGELWCACGETYTPGFGGCPRCGRRRSSATDPRTILRPGEWRTA